MSPRGLKVEHLTWQTLYNEQSKFRHKNKNEITVHTNLLTRNALSVVWKSRGINVTRCLITLVTSNYLHVIIAVNGDQIQPA